MFVKMYTNKTLTEDEKNSILSILGEAYMAFPGVAPEYITPVFLDGVWMKMPSDEGQPLVTFTCDIATYAPAESRSKFVQELSTKLSDAGLFAKNNIFVRIGKYDGWGSYGDYHYLG